VLVLDINMPDGSGHELLPELLEDSPSMAVVVLTMQGEPAYAREAMRSGALGYVLKQSAGKELVEAVRSVARGCVQW
jgi:two-component system response regulator NreC